LFRGFTVLFGFVPAFAEATAGKPWPVLFRVVPWLVLFGGFFFWDEIPWLIVQF
jgi:hypothetical protein